MHTASLKRTIFLYRLFWMFKEPFFWAPIIITYINHVGGMSIPEIYIMEAVVVIGLVVLEIPTGALADLVGRRRVLHWGATMNMVNVIFLAFASTPLMIWISNIFWMIGFALISGADSAFLFDALKREGREAEYKKISGKAIGDGFFFVAFGSLAAGFLYSIDPRLPIALSAPFVAVSSFAAFFFPEADRREPYSARAQLRIMKESVATVFSKARLLWIAGFTMFIAVVGKLWFFTYNPYYELVGLDVKWYGAVFFGMNVAAWLTSRNAHAIEARLGERGSCIAMALCISIPIVLMGAVAALPLVAMTLAQNFVRGYQRPFLEHFLHRHVRSENRATVLSVQSALVGFASSIGLWTFGVVLGFVDLPHALMLLGGSAFVLGALIILTYKRIFS